MNEPLTTETHELPLQSRQASFQPQTINEDERTIEVTWTTGATARRQALFGESFDEELVVSERAVKLDRLNNGAPLLDSHRSNRLSDQIGVVERAWLTGRGASRQGRALVRFSERDEVQPIFQDIQAGIIRNLSTRYQIHAAQRIDRDDDVTLLRVTEWEPVELSMVPVPVDAGAQVRSTAQGELYPCEIQRSMTMPKKAPEAATGAAPETEETVDVTTETAERATESERAETAPLTLSVPAAPEVDEAEIARRVQAGIAEQRQRANAISNACRSLNFDQTVEREMIESDVPMADALAALMERAVKRDEAERIARTSPLPRFEAGDQDEDETRAISMRSALLHRSNPDKFERERNAIDYQGMTLIDMARDCLENAGIRTRGMPRGDIAGKALTPGYGVRAGGLHHTTDFPSVLADVANKSLRRAYDESPRTFVPFTRRATAPDFKSINRPQLGEAPSLVKTNEHGEFRRGTIGDSKEVYALATYGRIFGITREAIINDDLNAFTRLPALFGDAAARMESDVVWMVMTANENMGDGIPLFHANHGNLAASGGAISVATVGAGREAMRTQRGLDGEAIINIQPAFLIVPAALETVAEQFLSDLLYAPAQDVVIPTRLKRSLEPLVEPRLDADSQTAWYLSASPGQIDTIEYAFLEGEEGVNMETRMGFDIDGMELRAREDFAAKALDWRGLYKNPGA